ncbi:multidrug ABC transporter permease/ATPase [Paenibacillus sp. FSL R7-269]|uniref:ATP-binding cassette domain-containing protein n=1 Tax=Paenibacillus sp. FSL R7-269 TaxID=1226755 RepID=UPI0003E26F65|nr:ATP-binding cassette domain-containing protein [Paenibacillus sp. FSL R7-269]ETT48066.1 multidrug ABC transporter permease/ATPase [Paenibacillus sp. FSL R7-269]
MNRLINSNQSRSIEEKSNPIQRVFFTWTRPFINKAIRKDLPISAVQESCLVIPSAYGIDHFQEESESVRRQKNVMPLIMHIVRQLKFSFLAYALLAFLTLALQFSIPYLFPDILRSIINGSSQPHGKALGGIFLFIAIQMIKVICNSQFLHFRWKLITSIEFNYRNILFKNILRKRESSQRAGQLIDLYGNQISWLRGIVWFIDGVSSALGVIFGVALLVMYLGVGGLMGCLLLFAAPMFSRLLRTLNQVDTELSKVNSKRLFEINDFLHKFKEAKQMNFTNYFIQKIKNERSRQSEVLHKKSKVQILLTLINYSMVPLTAMICIGFSSLMGYPLSVEKTMASFIVFGLLDRCINDFLVSINTVRQGMKAISLVQEYVSLDEFAWEGSHSTPPQAETIALQKASFSNFTDPSQILLTDIDLTIAPGQLVVLVGETGSGKTTLLRSIAGYLECVQGESRLAQQCEEVLDNSPLFPVSIRDNIILDRPYEEARYDQIIHACELGEDLEQWASGDSTIINTDMVNLSGGQIKRILLARAAYQGAQVVLLDQILNSLDAKVRKRVLRNLILDFWKDTTRIMVAATIDQELFEQADQVIVMREGRIQHSFQNSELNHSTLREFLPDEIAIQIKNEITQNERSEGRELNLDAPDSDENTGTKQSGLKILKNYFLEIGNRPILFLFIFLFILAQIIDVASIYIVPRFGGNAANPILFSSIYFGVALLLVLTNIVRISIIYLGNVKAGESFHQQLLQRVSKMSFLQFSKQQNGSLSARFSNDMKVIDMDMSGYTSNLLESFFKIITASLLIAYSDLYMVLVLGVFLIFFNKIQKEVRITGKITSKLANEAHEPCLAILKSAAADSDYVRKKNLQVYLLNIWKEKISYTLNAEYTRQSVNRFYLFWIEVAGYFTFSAFLILMSLKGFSGNPVVIYVTLTYTLTAFSNFEVLLRDLRHMEIGTNSLERILDLENEESPKTIHESLPPFINTAGGLTISNLSAQYNDSRPIISGLTLKLEPNQNLLVKGRTGSGKSTLFYCLTQFMDYEGEILLGDTNVKSIPDHLLAKKIVTLPQRPVLYHGTLRENLDPELQCTDQEIWSMLEKLKLKGRVSSLEQETNEYLDSFSQGEKQLLNMGRCLLLKPELLLIDEATTDIYGTHESDLYRLLSLELPNTMVIGISHKDTQSNFYHNILDIEDMKLKRMG